MLCYEQHKDVFLTFIVFIWAFPLLWLLLPIDVFSSFRLFFSSFRIFDCISRACWGNRMYCHCIACVASASNRVIARKLERKQKKRLKGEGEGRRGNAGERSFSKSWGLRASGSFFPLPLPRHSFFLLLSQLSRRTSRGNACYAG